MLRVFFIIAVAHLVIGAASAETHWRVTASEGLDAVLFIGALSGDKLQSEPYAEEIAHYRPLLNADETAALDRIGEYFAKPGHGLAGPKLAYFLAAAPDQSYAGVGAVLAAPQDFFKGLGETLDGGQRNIFEDFSIAYAALERIGFVARWRDAVAPIITGKTAEFETFLAPYDIIPLQEKYLGRDLEDEIEILVLNYNRPYGIRVLGQRFATYHGWSMDDTLRIAAHEIFHPPYDGDNKQLKAAARRLRADGLIKNIIAKTDPKFGYSTFNSILDEDSTQALDTLVSEAVGLERDPGEYWRKQDAGMHLLAAAIYDAMKETGFARTGGVYQKWLIDALNSDVLSPEAVERRARAVMGDAAVDKWKP